MGSGQSDARHEMDIDAQKPKFYELHSNVHRSELDGSQTEEMTSGLA